MFEYQATADARTPGATTTSAAPASVGLSPGAALAIARRNLGLIVGLGILGAFAAIVGSDLLTPKYVATAEIYVDPGAAVSASAEPIAPGEDSNGFVNYVESQALIVTSRSVLERVAKAEGLDHDEEFTGDAEPSFLSFFSRPSEPGGDPIAAAARAFSSHVWVKRPERTFVLDISVYARDPKRAAELANATAKAYMEEVSQLHGDSAKETGAAIALKLEALRSNVINAEQAIEGYKSDNGLVGARDLTLIEQQLKDLDDEIATQRSHESDARARAESAEAARKNGVDLGAFAAEFGLMTLSQLRGQQAEARQKLADALADLGPRHPQAIQAQAQLDAANASVDAELERFARGQRLEYQRAKDTEADLSRQLDALKKASHSDESALVGLRDLERKAQAARDVYELFVSRSRDSGEIQEVAPVRSKVITVAAPPKTRTFPPSTAVLAGLGLVGGMALGFVLGLARESAGGAAVAPTRTAPIAAEPRITPAAAPPWVAPVTAPPSPAVEPPAAAPPAHDEVRRFVITANLTKHESAQSLDRLDLTGLGFSVHARSAERSIFAAILEALPGQEDGRRVIAVVGPNVDDQRSALAINLALAGARMGRRVALLDAAARNAKITRAVRTVASSPVLEGGPVYNTENGVRLVLPKAGDPARGHIKPMQALNDLLGEYDALALDLIVCDGPDASEVGAAELYGLVDAIVALDDPATVAALEPLGFAPAALARFAQPQPMRKQA